MFLIKKCICPYTNIAFGGAIIIQAASKAQFPGSQQQADLAILPGDGARRQATVRDGARCATVRDGARATTLWRQEIHHFRAVEQGELPGWKRLLP